jgi:Ca2+-binding EF-hand superfamily protein
VSPDRAEASRLFSRYDTDGNHRVDLDEFKNFYRSVWDTQTKMAQLAKAPSANAPR